MGYKQYNLLTIRKTIMIEPDIDWQWCFQHPTISLQTRHGLLQCTVPLSVGVTQADEAFTLQQAEWFWLCRHALEPLQWPENALLCACIDAVAQLSFTQETGDKSFYLQPVSSVTPMNGSCVTAFSLVQVLGQNYALALVLASDQKQHRVLLLSDLDSLTGRTLPAGRTLLCRPDRLLPLGVSQAALAKSA